MGAVIWKLLGWQGCVGLVLSLVLGLALMISHGETRHWKKQSAGYEQLYRAEQVALGTTVANYRLAATQAHEADLANVQRVKAEQTAINERVSHDFEVRIADARARAGSLRPGPTAADSSGGATAGLPASGHPASGSVEAAGQGGLSEPDALIATEQAIQLDEIIKWVRQQSGVEVSGEKGATAAPGEASAATQAPDLKR